MLSNQRFQGLFNEGFACSRLESFILRADVIELVEDERRVGRSEGGCHGGHRERFANCLWWSRLWYVSTEDSECTEGVIGIQVLELFDTYMLAALSPCCLCWRVIRCFKVDALVILLASKRFLEVLTLKRIQQPKDVQ